MDSDTFGHDTIGELVFIKSSPELRAISLQKIGDIYKVFLTSSGGLTRTFNTETLPDEIKIKLTMLLSIDDHNLPELLMDIGWATGLYDNSYCIMVDEQTYAGLRGEY